MQPLRPLAPVVAILTLTACGAGESASSAAQVSRYDSAGIHIVETAAPAWNEPGQGWRLSAEATLQIGVVSGDPEYQFDRIMGTVRFDDGTIAVGTMGSGSIRYYDAEGNFLREAGRPGEGPGEFRQLMGIGHFAGDTIMADNSRRNVLLFDAAGRQVGTLEAGSGMTEKGYVTPAAWFANGTVLGVSNPQGPPDGSTGAVVDSADLMFWDGAEYGPTALRVPLVVWSEGADPRRLRQQFGPGPSMATHGNRLYFSFSRGPDVLVFEPADDPETGLRALRFVTTLRHPGWTPEPVTQEAIDEFTHQYVNEATGEDGQPNPRMAQLRRNNLERMSFADHFPAHGRMLVDRAGGVWLQEYVQLPTTGMWNQTADEPVTWHAHDPDGAWMGPVEFPAHFFPFEIGEDYVLGLWRDDMDVEYVRIYGLEKGG